MRMRKILIAGAAAVAAGLLGFMAPAQASAAITLVSVNGDSSDTVHEINGTFKSGTASFLGGTYGCTGGDAMGIVRGGSQPPATGSTMEFDTLNIICSSPVGGDAIISVNPGCTVDVDYSDDVNPGLVDNVDGIATMPPGCVEVSALAGACTADVEGTVPAVYDEANQDLILSGSGLELTNGSGCLGLLDGPIDLNDITFDIEVKNGGNVPGIDFS